MVNPIISVNNVTKSYSAGKNQVLEVLRGVSLAVEKGKILAIVGASGVGKSTLLHILGALDRPTAGSVEISGKMIFELDDQTLADFRNKNVGFVFQFHHLLPEFSAVENVAMPALIAGQSLAEAEKKARALLEQVKIASRANARPTELSGGEQQRVAVARALINEPQVVLADEPSGNLDEENAEMLHSMLWQLAKERNQTFIVVTHDNTLAQKADAVYRIHEGLLHQEK